MARVEYYMQTHFNRIVDTAPVLEALKTMVENQYTHLVVTRGGLQIAGILTRTDLINLRGSIVLKEGIVRDVLADQALIVITPQDYMQDARNRFERYPNIDQIVVVELLNPVGILTRDDLLRWMYEEELMKSD